jgi:peptidoglycan/LPS O-acetylase OafA/YrhL
MPVSARPEAFRADIEGLRAVAILLVVGCHCGIPWCAGGFVGVDVFFVLSGYLITGLLAQEYRESSRIDLPRFYARRARRLLPACALVLVATVSAAAAIYGPGEIQFTARAARATSLYVSNVFFDRSATDYFAPEVASNPLLHTWSLGVEEQFYLLWPLLMLATRAGISGGRRAPIMLGTVAAVSFLCCLITTSRAPTFAFYELPARGWEFAAGGLLAFVPASNTSTARRTAEALGYAGVALILGSALLFKGGAGFPGALALLPVAGTLATLYAGANAPRRGIGALLGAAPMQFLGARSYAWYLWHWPFIVFAGVVFVDVTVGGRLGAAIASLVVAGVTYRLVEHPVRESPYLSLRWQRSLGAAIAVLVLTLGASWALAIHGRQQLAVDGKLRLIATASTDIGDIPGQCYSEGRFFDAKLCTFGDASASRTIVLFGDSHAMQWVNPLRTAAMLAGWRLLTLVRPGCAASDINPHNLSRDADHCKDWRAQAIERIQAVHPTAVVLASYNGAMIRGDFITPTLMSAEEVRSGTRRTLERLSGLGVPLVVMRDTPLPPFNIPSCEIQRLFNGRRCEFDASVAVNSPAFAAEHAAADGMTQVYFLDMDDLICPDSLCPARENDLIIYRDEDHLTGRFAESLAPAVRSRLAAILDSASPVSVVSR